MRVYCQLVWHARTHTRFGNFAVAGPAALELSVRRTSTTGLVNGYVSSTTEGLVIHCCVR